MFFVDSVIPPVFRCDTVLHLKTSCMTCTHWRQRDVLVYFVCDIFVQVLHCSNLEQIIMIIQDACDDVSTHNSVEVIYKSTMTSLPRKPQWRRFHIFACSMSSLSLMFVFYNHISLSVCVVWHLSPDRNDAHPQILSIYESCRNYTLPL